MIKVQYTPNQINDMYNIICSTVSEPDKRKIEKFLATFSQKYTFEQFITLSIQKIFELNEEIKKFYPKSYPCTAYKRKEKTATNKPKKKTAIYVVDSDDFKLLYDYFDKINKCKFVEYSNITVCPYCNRNYINNRGGNQGSQVDHFLARSKYPIFAICINNLVPSCSTCNILKGAKGLSISPYDEKFNFDDELKFSFYINGIDLYDNYEQIELMIETVSHLDAKKSSLEENVKLFKLREAYSIHNNLICNILKLQNIYSDSYINTLLDSFPELFNSRIEVLQSIYRTNFNHDFANQPLGKLKNDILKEIGVF